LREECLAKRNLLSDALEETAAEVCSKQEKEEVFQKKKRRADVNVEGRRQAECLLACG